ncbi:type VII secretion protein EccB [Nocardia stercoris]|uniref:Type VII secretion protein EccB n=1 Tax=Nocardia stercoris TaxID=2483361 RepID=A0A3M2L181_9NOCA|nr:type VII secretion protein EccB [Nocardia stercoris]
MARFRVVTKHQVSGWRFLFRRIDHALVRRDASMIDDPQRGRSTALSVGIALACVLVAASAVLAFFKPAKQITDSTHIVAEQGTGALYVFIGGRLYPALNLTSARLAVGDAENPTNVTRDELARFPRGPLIGISGAPGVVADSGVRDSSWAICDTATIGPAAPVDQSTGLPTTGLSSVHTTVIGTQLRTDPDSVRPIAAGEARLLRDDATTWLVYPDRDHGVVRAALNLGDSAVMLALGIDATAPVAPVSKGLLSAIPEVPPIKVPDVPGAGSTVTLSSGMTVPVGAVLAVSTVDQTAAYYLVSQSGVVQISSVLAAMVRNADAHGTMTTIAVRPDVIAANLRPGGWPGTASFPDHSVHIVDPERSGVTCFHWSRASTDPSAATTLLVGRQLPLSVEEQRRTVPLVTAQTSHGATADAAYMPRDTGRFVQVTGMDPVSPRRETLFWISDSGVRYGIDAKLGDNGDPTLNALGLKVPVPAPWSAVSLFAVGPTLSQADARILHEGLPVDKSAVGLPGGNP